QRRGVVALLSAGRRDHRGDDLQLSRHRKADGGRGFHPRPPADPDLRDDLLPRLSPAHHGGRHHCNPVQSEACITEASAISPARGRFGYRINLVRLLGLTVVLAWAVIALLAPRVIPHSVGEIVDTDYFGPMSRELWFGSDYLGRDMFSRIMMGARYTV